MTIYTPHMSWHRNPLAYPAGYRPGFDPSHPASAFIRNRLTAGKLKGGSFISQGGNMVDIVTGIVGTITGTVTPAIDKIGPTVSPVSTGTVQFSGYENGYGAGKGTVAGIFIVQQNSGYGENGGVYAGQSLALRLIESGGTNWSPYAYLSGSNTAFPIFPYAGYHPYFMAVSGEGAEGRYIWANLQTGKIGYGSFAASGSQSSDGLVRMLGPSCNYACTMYSTAPLSMAELHQWAADPWSFWYPNPGDNWIAAQAAAAAFSRSRMDSGFGSSNIGLY